MNKLVDTYNDLLAERGSRYGSFYTLAGIAQALKEAMHHAPNWHGLDDDQKESLQLVTSKIARILNGDPNYVDNWDDIAGYAKLVADRLRGIER